MAASITTRNADRLQHVAVTRLQLYVTGRVHALLYPFQAWLTKEVRDSADADGIADASKLAGVVQAADTRWRAVMRDYVALLDRARQQGGSIAFGPYRLRHNRYFTAPVERLQEAFTPTLDDWSKLAEMWLRRRNYALQVAQQRAYSDGLNLSQRIWRLEQGGMQTIRNTIATGMAQRTSAVELAQQLEGQLNAGEDWPRWTRARLSKMDARERAQDAKGLLRSASDVPPGGSSGISYNALRLARNEIQIANHAVTSDIAIHSPWVTGRKVVLSPAHPKSDQCDTFAAGGPYDKTANFLPLHPQCVTPGQLVWTKRGQIPVESVQVGDEVLTHTGRFCPVTAAWSSFHNDRVYIIETDRGRLEVTGNHPVLTMRGWVNADKVQLGDQVLYAASGILTDLARSVAEDAPALFGKSSIADDVFAGIAVTAMPSDAIHLDTDFAGNESEVQEIASNLELAFVDQADGVQSVNHGQLCATGVIEPPLPVSQEHRHEPGVISFLSSGDFAANVEFFGGVPLPGHVASVQPFLGEHAHLASPLPAVSIPSGFVTGDGDGAPRAIVLGPEGFGGFASGPLGNSAHSQKFTQHPVSESVAVKDFRRTEILVDVDVAQEVGNGPAIFSFDAQGVPLRGGQAMSFAMGVANTSGLQAANGASKHDNLLLLSPDSQWGAGSGNPGVRGVITPSQALLHYTPIRAIQRRYYTGNVYNMTVEGDNSYTVGGHVVHNCLCRWEEVLMPPGDFTKQVRGWVAGENDFLDDYSSWLGQRSFSPLPEPLGIAAAQELFEAMQMWLDGNTDAMATVLRV